MNDKPNGKSQQNLISHAGRYLGTLMIAVTASISLSSAHASGFRNRIQAADYDALVELYNATGGPAWKDRRGWLNPHARAWHGVTLSGGRVTSLALGSNRLTGSIPASIGKLTGLNLLYLGNNNLGGKIPASIGNLTSLTVLYAGNNRLTGSIPDSLELLSQLTKLDLHANKLTGAIPSSLGNLSQLTELILDDNRLTGSIPDTLGNLASLSTLNLATNQLTGNIPDSLGGLSQLTLLLLDENQLTGPIPTSLGNLSQLSVLELTSNQLTGVIPDSLGNLFNLTQLYLGRNQLSGGIPVSLGNLSKLTLLHLFDNQLTGAVPASIGNLTNLTSLDIEFNHFTGAFPELAPSAPDTFVCDVSYNSLDFSQGSKSLSNIMALTNVGNYLFNPNVTYLPQGSFVAGKGDLVGPNLSSRLLTAGSPAVDAAGEVTFRAILTGTARFSKPTTGILFYSGTAVTVVASTDAPAPGTAGTLFSTLDNPVLSGSGALAFVGTLKTGVGITAADSTGVWVSTGGTTNLIVRTGQVAPTDSIFPGPVVFASIKEICVNNTGGLTILAGLAGQNVKTTGLFSADARGRLTLLLYKGKSGQFSAPHFTAFLPLRYVMGQSRSLDSINGNIAILGPLESATNTVIATFLSGTSGFDESFLAETGAAAPGLGGITLKSFDEPAINSNGTVAFSATLSGTGITEASSGAICLASGADDGFIARAGLPASDYGGLPYGIFSGFDDPVINNNGAVAFIGTFKVSLDGGPATYHSGIWSDASGTLDLIAIQTTSPSPRDAQNPLSITFSKFDQLVLPDAGGLIFLADLSGVPAAQNQCVCAFWNGQMTPLVSKGGTLYFHGIPESVKTLDIFRIAPTTLGQTRSFDASTGNFVYGATFPDGNWGIYKVTPP